MAGPAPPEPTRRRFSDMLVRLTRVRPLVGTDWNIHRSGTSMATVNVSDALKKE